MGSRFLSLQNNTVSSFYRKRGSKDEKSLSLVHERNNSENSTISPANRSLDQPRQNSFLQINAGDRQSQNKQRLLRRKSTFESSEAELLNQSKNESRVNLENMADTKKDRSKQTVSTNSRVNTNADFNRTPSNLKSNFHRDESRKSSLKIFSDAVKTPKKTPQIKQPAIDLTYNNIYSSANFSSLIYVPEHYLKVTPTNKKSGFTSFNELSRKEKSQDMERLEKILQAENDDQYFHDDHPRDRSKIELMCEKLEFNRQQKYAYKKAIDEKMRRTFLPLINHEQEAKARISKMPKIKTYPSKRLIMQQITDHPEINTNQDDLPEVVDLQDHKADFYKTASSGANLLYSYRFFWYFQERDSLSWKPSGRESCTMTTVGKYIVLYGGLSNSENDEIVVYDPMKKVWSRPKLTGEMPFYGRHGHTALEYKRNVIFFGGEKKYNQVMALRECLNDTRSYNPEKNEWRFYKCVGQVIEPRRNHAAAIYDRMMYVYGGISSHGRYLQDVWSLNLSKYLFDAAKKCLFFTFTRK